MKKIKKTRALVSKLMNFNIPFANIFDYKNKFTLIYGPPASGKTTICLQAAVSCVKEGKKVYFLDTEGGFSVERLGQLGGSSYLNNMMVMKETDFKRQCLASKKLLALEDAGLVIVDSITKNYREAMHSKVDANPWMSRHLGELKEIAKKGVPVIVTSQVYTKMDGSIETVGSSMLKSWSDSIIKLNSFQNKRIILIEKHNSLQGKAFQFEILNEGIFLNE